ncbi:protein PBDC1-like [Uloborus diversus]|uniref:protein PBDC1-like n=1 Tax=Uloborus diversus TaxID=327109 RepID=UPI00240A8DF0|nr:protein PBDC1-like [Uloborus diversus]
MASEDDVEKRMFESYLEVEDYSNNPEIEKVWAGAVMEDMMIHYNLLTSVPPRTLRLSPFDDEIYEAFTENFHAFKLDVLEEDSLKSWKSKEKWRKFIQMFQDKINNATFGTLIRIDSSGTYEDVNTIFVVRIQFLAIEIARNRRGLNDKVYLRNKIGVQDKKLE